MSRAQLLAAAAAAAGVGAGWSALGAVDPGALALRAAAVLGPWRAVGEVPVTADRRRMAAMAALTLLAAGWMLAGPVAGLVAAAAGPTLAARLRARRLARWRARAAADAPVAARALADALAGGHSVRGALAQAAAHGGLGGPAGEVLRGTAARLAAGATTDAALADLRARTAAPAWDAIVAAMLLARDTGGDLAGLLRSLAVAGEEHRRAAAEARTATAQARTTALIVALLPVGAAALALLADPGMAGTVLSDPRALALLAVGVLLQGGALLAVRRIARLRP